MKIIRTANVDILKSWLTGGQNTNMGNYSEGFFCFNVSQSESDELIKNNAVDYETVKETVIYFINEFSNEPSNSINHSYFYWGDYYKFKMPNDKNLKILIDRIYKEMCKNLKDKLSEQGASS